MTLKDARRILMCDLTALETNALNSWDPAAPRMPRVPAARLAEALRVVLANEQRKDPATCKAAPIVLTVSVQLPEACSQCRHAVDFKIAANNKESI